MPTQAKEGYILDYISGKEIKATPEEIEATQVFSKTLVEEYGYPKNYIQTRPQFYVKQRPSDNDKSFPIDIAVFTKLQKIDDNLLIVVECKKKNRKDGITQLHNYLTFSKANIGVWFNGQERVFIRKIWKNEEPYFEEIPNIPKYGERLEDIGLYKRKDLEKAHNLKQIFKVIRNHLAGNTTGTTRDEELARQIINLLFCKIYTEKFTLPNAMVAFRAGVGENPIIVGKRIKDIFSSVKSTYRDVFESNDQIDLDDNSIVYVVGSLQKYCLMDTERDVIADAFEVFISHALKGGQGQFFTPRNIVKFIIDFLDPSFDKTIIDPACGSGGFLIESLKHIWNKLEIYGKKYSWNENVLLEEKKDAAIKNIRGIEKDTFLSKVTKAYMAIMGDGRSGICCENSLEKPIHWKESTRHVINLEKFDYVVANPPFGSKIPVKGNELLKQYDLGHKWKYIEKKNIYEKQKIKDDECPEILFIERILQLLKPNGMCGIVLPDGIFNDTEGYVRQFLLKNTKIIGIVDLCKEAFQPNTQTKTSLIFLKKESIVEPDYDVFMGVAYYCGHNRRGIQIEKDDLPKILNQFKRWFEDSSVNNDKNCFVTNIKLMIESDLWIPKHYSPYYIEKINLIKQKYPFKMLDEIATIKKGDEVGSNNYINFIDRKDTDIPFIRTGDLVNNVVNQIPDNFVDVEKFNELKQDLIPNDILFTKDGKIGLVAMLMESDKVIVGSGIVRIRVKKEAYEEFGITNEYLFSVLSNKFTGYFQSIRNTVIAATIPHLRESRLSQFIIPILDRNNIKKITENISKSLKLKNESNKLDKLTIDIFDHIK